MLRSVTRQLMRAVPRRAAFSAEAAAAAPKKAAYRKGPWSNHDAWRQHPMLVQNNVMEIFPGLQKALVLFGIYCGLEFCYKTVVGPSVEDHGHGGHGDGHAHAGAASGGFENSVSSTGAPTPKH